MSTLSIELNDAGVLVRGDSGPGSAQRPPSPGYALIDGDALLTGPAALARSRLQPRRVDNRFWSEPDTAAIDPTSPSGLSRADLAHAHLSSIWNGLEPDVDSAILCIPGSYSQQQLALILGIAQACGIPVRGLVDAAVAAAAWQGMRGDLLHLDLQLHRVVLTALSGRREIVRRQLQVSDHTGLVALWDRWSKRIAQSFVHNTRFDPLHGAATEQALFDQLPGILQRLCESESTVVEMESGGRVHRIELERDELVHAAEADFDGVVQLARLLKRAGRPATLLLSHRAAGLPGLRARVGQVGGLGLVELAEGAAADGALRHSEHVRSAEEALPFVTRLPIAEDAAQAQPMDAPAVQAGSSAGRDHPTHLLHDGRAYPITHERLVLGVAVPEQQRGINLRGRTAGISRSHCSVYRSGARALVEDHSTHGSFLNGQRVDGSAELSTGDLLRLGIPGIELQVIRVLRDDGAT